MRKILDAHVSEKLWQQWVTDLAKLKHWRCYHTFDSRRSTPGFPDLVLVRHHRLIVAELKAEKGRLTPPQKEWLDALAFTGIETYVWRPSEADDVLQILK